MVLDQPVPRASAFRPELPAGLDEAIGRCLAKHPAERFQNVADLAFALLPFAPGAPASSSRHRHRARPGASAPRRRRGPLLGLVLGRLVAAPRPHARARRQARAGGLVRADGPAAHFHRHRGGWS